jgi:hypothetical protein
MATTAISCGTSKSARRREAGFQQADVILEDYYTPFQEHGYEELECSIGVPDGGGVVVYCGSQDRPTARGGHWVPEEQVRVARRWEAHLA